MSYPSTTHDYVVPGVEYADVNQELELARLEQPGKRFSAQLIRLRLQHHEAFLTTFTSEVGLQPVEWADYSRHLSLDQYERLASWALTQPALVIEHLESFLNEPTEDGLEDLLDLLGLQERKEKRTTKSLTVSLASEIQKQLRKAAPNHVTRQDLYQLGRQWLSSRRPEAAVRQALRRLLASGAIRETQDGYYI